jgi:uncharacterized protein (TIGR02300 family)
LRVAKPKWGIKRECQGCGAHFYDLKRSPIICPKCDAKFVIEVAKPKPQAEKKVEPKKEAPPPTVAEKEKSNDDDTDKLVADDDAEGESFVVDTSELGGGGDVVGLVIPPDAKNGDGDR